MTTRLTKQELLTKINEIEQGFLSEFGESWTLIGRKAEQVESVLTDNRLKQLHYGNTIQQKPEPFRWYDNSRFNI